MQHGVITHAQLLMCGWTANAIARLAACGWLVRLHPATYAVGTSALTVDGRRLAAVLACGIRAVLSHRDAGALWNLCTSAGTRFSVTVPTSSVRGGPRTGIEVHRRDLRPEEVTMVDGVPVTSVARTLLDLATVLPFEQLCEAVDQAIALGLFDPIAVHAVMGRGRRGTAALRRALAEREPEAHRTKSRWERRMLALVAEHGLPRPEVNAWLPVLGVSPDLLWPDPKVAVEWDSWSAHDARRRSFEEDRRKTVELQAAGYVVLRFTWRQTRDRPDWVIGHVIRALRHVDRPAEAAA